MVNCNLFYFIASKVIFMFFLFCVNDIIIFVSSIIIIKWIACVAERKSREQSNRFRYTYFVGCLVVMRRFLCKNIIRRNLSTRGPLVLNILNAFLFSVESCNNHKHWKTMLLKCNHTLFISLQSSKYDNKYTIIKSLKS